MTVLKEKFHIPFWRERQLSKSEETIGTNSNHTSTAFWTISLLEHREEKLGAGDAHVGNFRIQMTDKKPRELVIPLKWRAWRKEKIEPQFHFHCPENLPASFHLENPNLLFKKKGGVL